MPALPANLRPVRSVFKDVTGKDLSPQTQNRLRLSGSLPMWFILGTWHTTPDHVAEFIERQTAKRLPAPQANITAPAERSPATQRRLERAGISSADS